jgi:hypothetical protein
MLATDAMTQWTVRSALVAAALLLVISCGREPLDPLDVDPTPADAGAATPTTPPPDQGPSLSGIWSGDLQVSAPGLHWGPTDRFTIAFNADGSVASMQFASRALPPHTFGSGPEDFPLQGTRDAPLTPGSIYTTEVTVEVAAFARDRFHLRYHVVGTGATPSTDYVEDVSGQLVDGSLDVTYSATGTLLILPITATASGQLQPA